MYEINHEDVKSTEFDVDLVILNTRKRISELVGISDELHTEEKRLSILLDMKYHYYKFRNCYSDLKRLHRHEVRKPQIRDNVLKLTIKGKVNG